MTDWGKKSNPVCITKNAADGTVFYNPAILFGFNPEYYLGLIRQC